MKIINYIFVILLVVCYINALPTVEPLKKSKEKRSIGLNQLEVNRILGFEYGI